MLCAGVWAVTAGLSATDAAAQVLEIGDSGEVTTYAAPAVFTSQGVAPIQTSRQGFGMRTPAEVGRLIAEAAQRHSVSEALARAVAFRESGLRQAAVSQRGAVGVMQLMSGTARGLGVDRFDLKQNIEGGVIYLGQMLNRYRGDAGLALAAYNAGPGAVDRYGGTPPYRETRDYVAGVLARLTPPGKPASSLIIGP